VRACIGLGANLGDGPATLAEARDAIAALPHTRLQAYSSLYRSAPIDAGGPDYWNAVALVDTQLTAHTLLDALQRIEQAHGRERPFHHAPRTLDLDLLLYGDERIETPDLVVPHPRLHERAFALLPLAEVWPDAQIPGRGTVHAVLFPNADSTELYFVARGDGTHIFTKSWEDHLRAIAMVRAQARRESTLVPHSAGLVEETPAPTPAPDAKTSFPVAAKSAQQAPKTTPTPAEPKASLPGSCLAPLRCPLLWLHPHPPRSPPRMIVTRISSPISARTPISSRPPIPASSAPSACSLCCPTSRRRRTGTSAPRSGGSRSGTRDRESGRTSTIESSKSSSKSRVPSASRPAGWVSAYRSCEGSPSCSAIR